MILSNKIISPHVDPWPALVLPDLSTWVYRLRCSNQPLPSHDKSSLKARFADRPKLDTTVKSLLFTSDLSSPRYAGRLSERQQASTPNCSIRAQTCGDETTHQITRWATRRTRIRMSRTMKDISRQSTKSSLCTVVPVVLRPRLYQNSLCTLLLHLEPQTDY